MAFFKKHQKLAFSLVVAVAIGFALGYWVAHERANVLITAVRGSLTPVQGQNEAYPLVKPLLAYRTPEATTYGEYTDLKNTLQNEITTAKDSGNVQRVSVYFRELDSGRWIGINENDTYYPASLLKVPLMITYYKEAEDDPSILNESLYYPGIDTGPFDATSTLAEGTKYTVNELLHYMIVQSDNGATLTLLNNLNPTVANSVYQDLGITVPQNNPNNYQISVRTYALFFRVLYNATYLSPEYSEKALELLDEDYFPGGLIKPLPSTIRVADKWGQHVLTDSSGKIATGLELHDCGIIYYPAHPYLLCVMTSAVDTPTAEQMIQEVSKTVYDAELTRYPSSS